MDDWNFLNEVDALAKWPADHKKVVFEGGKWSERKAGLEALNKIMEENPRLSTESMTIYGQLMDELRKILDKESNIVVVTTAAKTVELLANGLRKRFGGFIGMVFPFLIKRAKDKKKNVRDAVYSSVVAVAETTTPDRILKDLVDWFGIPSPESKQTLLEFLYQYFIKMSPIDVSFIKSVAPLIVACASEGDVNVREKAYMTIGSLKRLMGSAIGPFIASVSTDSSKMEKVDKYENQAKVEWEKWNEERKASGGNDENISNKEGAGEGETSSENGVSSGNQETVDPWTLLDAEDISKKLDKGVEAMLIDKNWKERVAGCEALKKEMDGVGRIEISDRLKEIMLILVKIIEKDVNVNVSSSAANVLSGIAVKSRFSFAPTAIKGFPVCFEKLKDKKAVLRDALNELIDFASTTTPLRSYSEAVQSGLSNKNPQTRGQTLLFLSRFFNKNDVNTVDKEALTGLIEYIEKTSNDADKEVREANLRCIAAMTKCVGETVTKRMFAVVFEDKLKSEKISTLLEEFEKEHGKVANSEMQRLAKQFNVGKNASSTSSGPKKTDHRAATAGSSRSMQNTAKPVVRREPIKPAVLKRGTDSVKNDAAPITKPKPFVARPAPSFGNKPINTGVRPASTTVRPTNTTARPATTSSSSRPTSAVKPVPRPVSKITPTVRPSSSLNRPTVNGASTVGIAQPRLAAQSSGIPRPGFTSRLPQPRSNIDTATGISKIRPPSRSHSKHDVSNA